MAVLIRVDELPASERVEAWLSVVRETFGPLEVRMDRDTPLRGQIDAARLGPLGVGDVNTATPHSVHRTARHIRRDDPGHFRVVLPVSGSVLLRQDGREARLGGGDLAIYDFARPYELLYDSAARLAVFSFAREALTIPADSVRPLTAISIPGDEGTAALAAPLLRRVAADVDTYRPVSAARLSTVVMDLLATIIAERAEQVAALPVETRERVLLRHVHDFIEQNLGDPGLTPGMIAAAHHVSPRQLHRLFEGQDTTVAGWVRHRRLERCRRDLADPLLSGQSVSAIAARRGLPDPAHFSRLFRQAYGVPPAEYRRTHGQHE